MKDVQGELELLVRSRYPCLALLTQEEDRAQELLKAVAQATKRRLYVWSMTEGWTQDGQRIEIQSESYGLKDEEGSNRDNTKIRNALDELMDHARDRELIVLLKDLPEYFDEPRVVRKLADMFGSRFKWTIVMTASGVTLPSLIEKDVTLVEIPLPDEGELRAVLMKNLRGLARTQRVKLRVPEKLIEHVVRAALGLTRRQADCVFRMAIVNDREFTEEDLDLIAQQKRQIIKKTGILEYYEHSEDLRNVGGLDLLKGWLERRRGAISDTARDYGLPQPKGVFLLGVQGCGKSLVAKAIASAWHMPLLRLDVGALFSSYIGKTEENMRTAFRVAESVAPAVLWVDEIEKGFSGVAGSGNTDAGTSARVFASFLTWMQEKTSPVFVVATANSIDNLPPELLRKGRFDDIFFVDLPSERERQEIFRIHIARKRRDPAAYDRAGLARLAAGYSGAEIEQAIVSAMYIAYPQGREFSTADIAQALKATVPLSKTAADKVQALRAWAQRRARWATSPDGGGA